MVEPPEERIILGPDEQEGRAGIAGGGDQLDGWPGQMRAGEAEAFDGAVGAELTVTTAVAQFALTQPEVVFRARA